MSRIDDGFATTITFANFPSVKFYEKEVTPPSVTGGGSNDTTTMRNTAWRTLAPKKLKSLGEAKLTAAYDPAVYSDIVAMLQVNQLITVTFPDGSTYEFFGWVDEFAPGAIKEGAQPTADVKILCSNQDGTGAETAPVYTSAESQETNA